MVVAFGHHISLQVLSTCKLSLRCYHSGYQCDQIERFLAFFGDILFTKVAKKYIDFWGLLWKTSLRNKNCCGYFLGYLWLVWAPFYFNIWSHYWLLSYHWSSKNVSKFPAVAKIWRFFIFCRCWLFQFWLIGCKIFDQGRERLTNKCKVQKIGKTNRKYSQLKKCSHC